MTTHQYNRDPHSNAGNCECGMAEESSAHRHSFTQAYRSNLCICAKPAPSPIHVDSATASPDPVYPAAAPREGRGVAAAYEAVRQARGDDSFPQTPILFVHGTEAAR